jgi:alpha-1,3-rhamnosyl/mannosyltransferase
VHLLDHLPDDALRLLYDRAEIFVYASLYEGFGIPVLEAFAAGLPLVASLSSSIPEVAGAAALLIDPTSPENIAKAVASISTQPELRQELIRAGRLRLELFSWKRAAGATARVLTEVVGSARG